MPLSLLDEKVRSRLRSGVAITSVAQCVGELVENAIDAEAKCIAVRVDISKYKIQVIDNGKGVTREDLNLIGQRYATSKCHTLSDLDSGLHHLGYRGEALASTIDVSGTVEICSRHHLSQQTFSKIFFHGHAKEIALSPNRRPSVGTTVTVHDFFYNLPVRRKVLSAVLETENIRQTLQGIALANPAISFSLRNDMVGECVLQTRRTNSVLSSFSMLFGSAKAGNMKEVNLRLGVLAVSGYISTDSHHNKLLQFIYVNGRLVKKTPLHSCINNVIANSLIVRGLSRQSTSSKWRSSNNEADVGTPKRVPEKNGMYVLMLKCPRTDYDICLEPAKTLIEFKEWDTVLDFLVQVVKDFLIKHSLTLGPECTGDEEMSPCNESSSGADNEGVNAESSVPVSSDTTDSIEEAETSSIEREERSHKEDMRCNEESSDAVQSNVTDPRTDAYEVESSVSVNRESAPAVLHLNRPLRSPLNQRSISSKLANILRNQKSKSNPLQRSVNSRNFPLSRRKSQCIFVSGESSYSQSRLSFGGHARTALSTASSCSSVTQASATSIGLVDPAVSIDNAAQPSLPYTPLTTASTSSFEAVTAHNRSPVPVSSLACSLPSLGSTSSVINTCMGVKSPPQLTEALPQISCAANDFQAPSTQSMSSSSNQFSDHTNLTSLSPSTISQNASMPTAQRLSPSSFSVSQNVPNYSDQSSVVMAPAKDSISSFQTNFNVSTLQSTRSALEQQQQQQGSGVPFITLPDCSDCQASASASLSEYVHNTVGDETDGVCCIVERTETGFIIQPTKGSIQPLSDDRHCLSPPDQNVDSATTSSDTIWKEKIDPQTAKTIYIHTKTGNCQTSKPDNYPMDSQNSFSALDNTDQSGRTAPDELSTSYGARPIAAAPHLSFNFEHFLQPNAKRLRLSDSVVSHDLLSLSHITSGTGAVNDGGEASRRSGEEDDDNDEPSFHSLLRSWKNPAFLPGEEGILSLGGNHRDQIKAHNMINHYKFSKEMLESVKVLGQVDKKFVACILDTKGSGQHDLLVLFDQHAAHERVRLEALQEDLYDTPNESRANVTIKSSKVQPPLPIHLSQAEKRLARTFQKQLEAFGVTLVDDMTAISTLPSVLLEREASEIRRGRPTVALDLVQSMIIRHLEILRVTSGGSSSVPAALMSVLNSQACHSAIKFGDSLTIDECSDLIRSLSKCRLPFQCAHGRPSLAPVLDLVILSKKYPVKPTQRTNLCKKLSERYKEEVTVSHSKETYHE